MPDDFNGHRAPSELKYKMGPAGSINISPLTGFDSRFFSDGPMVRGPSRCRLVLPNLAQKQELVGCFADSLFKSSGISVICAIWG